MVLVGVVIVLAAIYLLVRRYEPRLVLFSAGVLMALLGLSPFMAMDAFVQSMTQGGLIQTICSVMGFAFVMKVTECDKHLVMLVASALKKVRPILIPGTVLATFAINIALPSAAGVSATVGTILIPLLISSGVHPATAGTAVLAGTYGSMLSPGLSHNPFVAKLANANVMQVIGVHSTADIVGGIIQAVGLTLIAMYLKEDKGYVDPKAAANSASSAKTLKPNILYAIIPIVPIALLVIGATGAIPVMKKVGVPHAMIIGAIIGLAVTRKNPAEITKGFFDGMGSAYANIMSIIICAGVFVGGMKALGLVDFFIKTLVSSGSLAKYAAAFGPFALSVIVGSGDAAAFAFNESVTPHAAQFGMQVINMGSMVALGGAMGRIMSPITPATVICAGLAGVNPMDLAKRNAPTTIIAVIVAMFILL